MYQSILCLLLVFAFCSQSAHCQTYNQLPMVTGSAPNFLSTTDLAALFMNLDTPTVVANAGAGTGATATISGNDTNGQITVNTKTLLLSSGPQATVTFGTAYSTPPFVILYPANSSSSSLGVLVSVGTYATSTVNGFTVNLTAGASLNTTYVWNYYVGGM